MNSLNSYSTAFQCGTRYGCISTLLRSGQRTLTERTRFLRTFNHYGELALGAFNRLDFYSFDFVRVQVGHWASQGQKVLALVV